MSPAWRVLRTVFFPALCLSVMIAGYACALTEEERNNIELYERLSPGVVNITSTVLERDFFLNIVPRQGAGSGAIIDNRGYILTNNHVIEDARKLEVKLANGKKYNARLVGADADLDIAVVKIDAPAADLTVIPMGSSADLKVGQKVLAIGNPFGLGQTLTTGIISSVGRTLRSPEGIRIENTIQTDASINPGNSGGPLIDSSGRIIGINTAIFSPTGGSVGIGFAIPIDSAKKILRELIEKGYHARPWLGATLMTLEPELARAVKSPVGTGVMIVELTPGSPAERAGLRAGGTRVLIGNQVVMLGGDIIVKVDGAPVTDAEDLLGKIEDMKPGDRVRLEVVRHRGDRDTVNVTLGESPAQRRRR